MFVLQNKNTKHKIFILFVKKNVKKVIFIMLGMCSYHTVCGQFFFSVFVSVHYSSKDKKINIKYILTTANTLQCLLFKLLGTFK